MGSGRCPGSAIVSSTIPSTMKAGRSYSVSLTVKTTGTEAWASAIRLGGIGGSSGNESRFGGYQYNMTEGVNVLPGGQYTFSFAMKAPAPGKYAVGYCMSNGSQWFGKTLNRNITVSG